MTANKPLHRITSAMPLWSPNGKTKAGNAELVISVNYYNTSVLSHQQLCPPSVACTGVGKLTGIESSTDMCKRVRCTDLTIWPCICGIQALRVCTMHPACESDAAPRMSTPQRLG